MDDAEIDELKSKLAASGVDEIPEGDGDVEELFGDVDEGVLDEFLERLSRVGIVGDVFLPVAFEKTIQLRGVQCASAHALLRALEGLRPELGLDEDESEREPRLAKQRNLWKRFRRGAKLSIRKRLVLELLRL